MEEESYTLERGGRIEGSDIELLPRLGVEMTLEGNGARAVNRSGNTVACRQKPGNEQKEKDN
jgi:hypothetical protein